jgi:ethanolamine utilization microcompartment shell protein EutL
VPTSGDKYIILGGKQTSDSNNPIDVMIKTGKCLEKKKMVDI